MILVRFGSGEFSSFRFVTGEITKICIHLAFLRQCEKTPMSFHIVLNQRQYRQSRT
jgi:hypothetical protein